MTISYPKRLIEVDLPIKRISAHARREKSIRHGHISTLHIWWARRPLAACRAVICAALWPDPADSLCPETFREVARTQMLHWTNEYQMLLSPESFKRFKALEKDPHRLNDPLELRQALLDFIADFANWDNSSRKEYLETSWTLTQVAHETLGGEPGTKPLVVDPFAGGGAIPLEALRIGADAFASDLNPVAVLLNKVVLEYIPKYGMRLADEVRKWSQWIHEQAEKELADFYPKGPDGAIPIAYLWARTIRCEGPGCGSEVPLIRSLWLSKRRTGATALKLIPNKESKKTDFAIVENLNTRDMSEGTVRKGSATCPVCGYTTPKTSVRQQLRSRHGGTADARLICVVTAKPGQIGRFYRLPTDTDIAAAQRANRELESRIAQHKESLSLVPNELLDIRGIRETWAMVYGLERWADYFTPRQALALSTLVDLLQQIGKRENNDSNEELQIAIQTILGLGISRLSDICSALCRWENTKTQVRNTFTRQALPIIWDYAEPNIFANAAGNYKVTTGTMIDVIERLSIIHTEGQAESASATVHPLPDNFAQAIITDPPYYDAVSYAYLSDFFFVWLRRSLINIYPSLFRDPSVPKDEEIVVDRPHELSNSTKNIEFYEHALSKAFAEARRVLTPDGIGTIVFASKTTASWEAVLQAVVEAGWIVTGSWPIDTELENRMVAQGQARLASSIHLICRPRENIFNQEVGDWRDVLSELPKRIHEWMPRLVDEGVVGADAIFACLGPAIEIFSRYSSVERASGEQVPLREYLEYVWAAVAREALSQIFEGVDTTGFDEDARITALWLWTLFSGSNELAEPVPEGEGEEDEEALSSKSSLSGGYVLEYDAARKIAQGLGVHLERLPTVVEVNGEKARLLPVAERTRSLFGKEAAQPVTAKRKKNVVQAALPGWSIPPVQGEFGWGTGQTAATDEAVLADRSTPKAGETVLDRLHQSMLLFSAGRTEALKRFLVEDGIGQDQRFWRLAQALSALYPMGSNEKRWVDGVLARKKGWGL